MKKRRIDCVDCGVDTYAVERVRDKVWTAAGMKPHGGRLCAGCLERRIGRPLIYDDFRPTWRQRLLDILKTGSHGTGDGLPGM